MSHQGPPKDPPKDKYVGAGSSKYDVERVGANSSKLKPSNQLFVLGVDKQSKKPVEEAFRKYGQLTESSKLHGHKSSSGASTSKQYCFMTYKDSEAASKAAKAMDGKYVADKKLTVEFSQTKLKKEDHHQMKKDDSKQGGKK